MRQIIQNSLREALQTLLAFMEQEANLRELEAVAGLIAGCLKAGNKVLIFGNGGSMADAMHFAEELTGRFRKDRKALPAIALSDPSFLTCVANDYGFDQVFARGVQAYASPGDVVIGISTSGNSPNVIQGLAAARSAACHTVLLSGTSGGALAEVCDNQILVPASSTARIQELHTLILHTLIECVEHILFPEE